MPGEGQEGAEVGPGLVVHIVVPPVDREVSVAVRVGVSGAVVSDEGAVQGPKALAQG